MSTNDLPMVISWFETAFPRGIAIGDPECTTWGAFADVFWWRREGEKDGPGFVPARFTLEPDGRHVRRLKRNLVARTAVVLDCEVDQGSGELPPPLSQVVARIRANMWAVVVYTSHNHQSHAPRYRIVLPLSEEIAPDLPAVEIVADLLGLLGVLDGSKVGAESLFYLPSAAPDEVDHHHTEVIEGEPIDAGWIRQASGALLAKREAEKERIAAAAHAQAVAHRRAKIAAGFGPDDSLIEKLRSHFDLEQLLLSRGYEKAGSKFRHPNSTSGGYGANIKVFGGIERVFSHNANDPLHASNLPEWCSVTALDAVDVLIILDFDGDRTRALSTLAQQFGLNKAEEYRKLAALIYKRIRQQVSQEGIESAAFTEGARLGLSRAEVCRVAAYVDRQIREAA